MKTHLRAFLMAVIFFGLVSCVVKIQACQCTEFKAPECARYWRSQVVFVAQVKSVSTKPITADMLPPGAKAGIMFADNRTARLQVQEVLRGHITGEVMDRAGGGADCLLEYKRGKRYLIFADSYDPATKIISTSVCSGSFEIKHNGEDYLASVRALEKQRAESSVIGQVSNYWTEQPLTGIEVLLQSNGQSYRTVTDKEGSYRFLLKQGGKFKVRLIFPLSVLEEGYAGVDYLSEGPARTVLGYGDALQAGQCHYKELHIASNIK